MSWMYLLIAGLTEIGWAVGLKLTQGWTRLWPSVVTLILIVIGGLAWQGRGGRSRADTERAGTNALFGIRGDGGGDSDGGDGGNGGD